MFTNGRLTHYGTSVPNANIEKRTPTHSEIKYYTLSPAELAEIHRKYPTEKMSYAKPSTVKVSMDEYWERKNKDKPIKIDVLTRDKYIELKEQGWSDTKIMNASKLPYNRLNHLKHKWGVINLRRKVQA